MKLHPWIERNRERHEWTAGIQISLPFDTIPENVAASVSERISARGGALFGFSFTPHWRPFAHAHGYPEERSRERERADLAHGVASPRGCKGSGAA